MQLQPDLPEGHLAIGFVHYYGDQDYNAAAKEFEIAKPGLPNEAEAYLAMGAIQRRQGKWSESTANLEKAKASLLSLSAEDREWIFGKTAQTLYPRLAGGNGEAS